MITTGPAVTPRTLLSKKLLTTVKAVDDIYFKLNARQHKAENSFKFSICQQNKFNGECFGQPKITTDSRNNPNLP